MGLNDRAEFHSLNTLTHNFIDGVHIMNMYDTNTSEQHISLEHQKKR